LPNGFWQGSFRASESEDQQALLEVQPVFLNLDLTALVTLDKRGL
jgi:hypothetical protein